MFFSSRSRMLQHVTVTLQTLAEQGPEHLSDSAVNLLNFNAEYRRLFKKELESLCRETASKKLMNGHLVAFSLN